MERGIGIRACEGEIQEKFLRTKITQGIRSDTLPEDLILRIICYI